MILRLAMLCMVALGTAACADTHRGATTPPFTVAVTFDETGGCKTEVGGKVLNAEQINDAARRWPNRDRVVIRAGNDTPYRCIGAFIYSFQASGFRKVDFDFPSPEPANPSQR